MTKKCEKALWANPHQNTFGQNLKIPHSSIECASPRANTCKSHTEAAPQPSSRVSGMCALCEHDDIRQYPKILRYVAQYWRVFHNILQYCALFCNIGIVCEHESSIKYCAILSLFLFACERTIKHPLCTVHCSLERAERLQLGVLSYFH
jgi:hypothetical protein